MKNNLTTLITFFLLALACSHLAAETNANKKAQAYYFAAEEAYGNKQYSDALTGLGKAEDLLGKSNAVLEGLKVKTLYDMSDYAAAKQALDKFYTYKASKNLEKEIAPYLLKVEGKLAEIEEKSRRKEEEARLAAAKKEDEARYFKESSSQFIAELESDMVEIPAGRFVMGSHQRDYARLLHTVTITPFLLSKYQVTQKQWKVVTGEEPSHFDDKGCDDCPVNNVSWDDVQGFIQKLNQSGGHFRLPSETEWEYACRDGSNVQRYCGGNDLDSLAWHSGNSGHVRHPVGQKQVNIFGLYDMNGNVGDWLEDCWHDSYAGAPNDNRAWTSGGDCTMRAKRGGYTDLQMTNYDFSTFRSYSKQTSRYLGYGFRLAKGEIQKVKVSPEVTGVVSAEELKRQEILQKRNEMKNKVEVIKKLF